MNADSMVRLKALFDAGTNPVYMTGQEAQELVAAGFVVGDAAQPGTVPGSCRVTITEAGVAALSAPPVAAAPPVPPAVAPAAQPVQPVISEVRSGIPVPQTKRRGGANNLVPRKSQYPFDKLTEPVIGEDGQPMCASFHVKATAEDPEPWRKMASNVSAANRRSEVEVKDAAGNVVMENVTKKSMIKGQDGKALLDEKGKRQYNETVVSQPKTEPTKKFVARQVGKDDPDGEGVRVFRVPLNF